MRSDAGDSESVDSSAGTFMQREADLSSLSDMTSDSEADPSSPPEAPAASLRLTSESDVEKPSTKKKRGVGRTNEEASENSSDSPASSDGSDYEPRPSNAPL